MLACVWFVFSFLFFKQKTAYEMRISDWSTDVCSSDLAQCIECTFDAEIRHLRADHRAAQIAVGVLPLRDDVKDLIAIDNIAVRIDKQTEIGRASCRERVCKYV